MTDDLISRQAAIDALDSIGSLDTDADREYARQVFNHLPTAEKKGKWEEKQDNEWAGGGAWVCSECGYGYAFGAYHEADEFNYCPNCGAKMDGGEE